MMHCIWLSILVSLVMVGHTPAHHVLQQAEINSIGLAVWHNESRKNLKTLVVWNKNELSLSMGIAHFTWYPRKNNSKPGMFPELLKFLDKHGYQFDSTLKEYSHYFAPWNTREEFLADSTSQYTQKLTSYLCTTIHFQMAFIVNRAQTALSKLMSLASTSQDLRHIIFQYNRLMASPVGRYMAVDYINFTGEGGLYKVLLAMKRSDLEHIAEEFHDCAKEILTKQAQNSAQKNQMRWLNGWLNRIKTYLSYALKIEEQSANGPYL